MKKVSLLLLWTLLLTTFLLPTNAVAATTADIQSKTGDGHLYTSGTNWDIISEQDAALVDTGSAVIYIDSTWDGSKFKNSRGVLFFQTTSSTAYTGASQVYLHFYVDTKNVTATNSSIIFFSTIEAAHPNYPLQQSDYNIDHYVPHIVGTVDCSSITTGQYNTISLPIGYWLSNSIVNVIATTSLDYTGEAPTGSNTVTIASADSEHPPYLRVMYGSGTVTTDADLQEVKSRLDTINILLGTVVDTQNGLITEIGNLRTSLGAAQQTVDPTLLAKVDSLSKSLSSLQQQETEQNKNITSILNQIATIPPLRTDLTGAVATIRTLSDNITAYAEATKDEFNGLRESTKPSPLVLVVLILVLLLCLTDLFILIKISRSAI